MALIKPGASARKARKAQTRTPLEASSKGDLKRLFVSQVRLDILKLFLLKSAVKFHVREITRQVGAEINAVRRELDNLLTLGLLEKTPQKNRLVYTLKKEYPHLIEILGLLVKDEGLGKALGGRSVGDVKFAFISVPFLLGRAATANDIDILLVGSVQMRRLGDIVKVEEKRRGQEINYAVLSEREFNELKKRRDPLILSALLQPKIILTPNSHEYLSL